jgi:hypothetical protein
VDGGRGSRGLQEDREEVRDREEVVDREEVMDRDEVRDRDEANKIEQRRPKEVQVLRLAQPYSSGRQRRTPPRLVDR